MKRKLDINRRVLPFVLFGTLAMALSACSGILSGKLFKERAAETPAPNEQVVDKSFFQDPTGQPKTFACAWAPDVSKGDLGENVLTPLVNMSQHCNIEFEITQSYLVGRMINPSYPDDRTRWKEAIKIPIRKHFYYEQAKDSHGRETNQWVENDQRSHWSARPKMTLDLSGLDIQEGFSGGLEKYQITSVEEIEWDTKSGFLGFSINTIHPHLLNPWSDYQGRFRVNFMAFKHDPTFQKVPYNQENSRFMNVLHVMGRMIEGVEPELFASHWDVRQTHKIYLNGVPKELESTVAGAIYKWNRAFQEAQVVPAGQLVFTPVIRPMKHVIDMRYPAINYIADRRIAYSAPLGVGIAVADVRNGKILWGTVTMFGGAIEGYINAYTPGASSSTGAASAVTADSSALSPIKSLLALLPQSFQPIEALTQLGYAPRAQLLQNFKADHQNFLNQEVAALSRSNADTSKGDLNALKAQLANFQSSDPSLNQVVADLQSSTNQELLKSNEFFKATTVPRLVNNSASDTSSSAADLATAQNNPELAKILSEQESAKKQALVNAMSPQGHSFFIEEGLTLENLGGSLLNSPARQNRTYPEMLESVIMHLALHEFGHLIGLGHQFKENIVPEAGSVPSRYVKELAAKATEENGFSNSTTVMGYRSGHTEMQVPASELKPGPHDELVLRYIYSGKYAAYDDKADDWVFTTVPPSGKIPVYSNVSDKQGHVRSLRTSYFPQCNDFEASWGTDPFCNRWDSGTTAVDLAKSYFEFLSDNLLFSLYSVAGGGSNANYVENRLWSMALNSFSRTRLFYDEMRRRLRSEPHLKPLWDRLRADQSALLEFSSACQKSDPTGASVSSPILREIFQDKGIVDLCRANALVLNEFKFYMNLPASDYTRIDHTNHYVSGGYLAGDSIRNYGHAIGSWYQMTNLPLKFAALYTATASTPFNLYYGWLIPNWAYDNEENRYSYSTLYPKEYTQLISDTVNHNMRFAATGMDDTTTMGRSILAAGGLLQQQRYTTNDPARLPRRYNALIEQQSQFAYGMVAVLVNAVTPDPSEKVEPDHYKKFTASIYDFFTGKNTTARDVFILPQGQILVWANGMFIYPITKIKFTDDPNGNVSGYVIAYKVSYDSEVDDPLKTISVKSALREQHDGILANCVKGFDSNGLISYFSANNPDFKGFKIQPGIAQEIGQERIGKFYQSIDEEFAKYESLNNSKIPPHYPIKSMQTVCDEAMRGVGQVSAAAALINGFWLGITQAYIEK